MENKFNQIQVMLNDLSNNYLEKVELLFADDPELSLHDKVALWINATNVVGINSLLHLLDAKIINKEEALKAVKLFTKCLNEFVKEYK